MCAYSYGLKFVGTVQKVSKMFMKLFKLKFIFAFMDIWAYSRDASVIQVDILNEKSIHLSRSEGIKHFVKKIISIFCKNFASKIHILLVTTDIDVPL